MKIFWHFNSAGHVVYHIYLKTSIVFWCSCLRSSLSKFLSDLKWLICDIRHWTGRSYYLCSHKARSSWTRLTRWRLLLIKGECGQTLSICGRSLIFSHVWCWDIEKDRSDPADHSASGLDFDYGVVNPHQTRVAAKRWSVIFSNMTSSYLSSYNKSDRVGMTSSLP